MRNGSERGEVLRRLRRIIFNAMSVVSLLMCLATVVLWVRCHYVTEVWVVGYTRLINSEGEDTIMFEISPVNGNLQMVLIKFRIDDVAALYASFHQEPPNPRQKIGWHFEYEHARVRDPARTSFWEKIGFSFEHFNDSGSHFWYVFELPIWCIQIALVVMPACRLLKWIEVYRRRKYCLCPSCGYDLRATPDRCPECGMVPTGVRA